MAKQKPSLRSVPPPGEEWIACRFPLPAYVMDRDPPYRPEAVVWLCSQGILHAGIFHPEEVNDDTIRQTLVAAIERPMAGKSRRPAVVRVPDPALVAPIRAVLGEGVPIHVRPVPEMDHVRELLSQFPGPDEPDEAAAWTYDPAIPEAAVAGFHRAAARLYQAAPWVAVPDDGHVLSIDVPGAAGGPGIKAGVLSVIGQIGQSYGILLHRSFAEYMAFRRVAVRHQRAGSGDTQRPTSMGAEVFSINFERGGDVPPRARQAFMRHHWELASPDAYPHILSADADLVARPLGERDVLLATLLCDSVAGFIDCHRNELAYGFTGVITERSPGQPGGAEVVISAPHPEAEREPALDCPDWGRADRTADLEGDDAEDAEIGAILDEFLNREEQAGRDEDWLEEADTLLEDLCHYKLEAERPDLTRWTAPEIERFLAELIGHAKKGAMTDISPLAVVEILGAFAVFLASDGRMSPRSASGLRRRMEQVAQGLRGRRGGR